MSLESAIRFEIDVNNRPTGWPRICPLKIEQLTRVIGASPRICWSAKNLPHLVGGHRGVKLLKPGKRKGRAIELPHDEAKPSDTGEDEQSENAEKYFEGLFHGAVKRPRPYGLTKSLRGRLDPL
jgi:hypothetical protein